MLSVKESSLCHLYVIVKVPFSLYNWKSVSHQLLGCIDPIQNILFKWNIWVFFSLSQRTRLEICHPCSYTLRANLYICCSGNGTTSICSHLNISAPSGPGLSFLSNYCSLCMSVYRQTRALQKLGQQTTPGLLQETKQNEVMEKRRLSAGLQSFLAWHNIRFVMTVNSILTLTETLARINFAHEFLLCVCLT